MNAARARCTPSARTSQKGAAPGPDCWRTIHWQHALVGHPARLVAFTAFTNNAIAAGNKLDPTLRELWGSCVVDVCRVDVCRVDVCR